MDSDRPVETWGRPLGPLRRGSCLPAPTSPQAFGQPELRGEVMAFQGDRGAAPVDHTDHRPATTMKRRMRGSGATTGFGNICH